MIAGGRKGDALALLESQISELAEGNPANDELLLFGLGRFWSDKGLRSAILDKADAAQAIRLEQAAEASGAPAKVRAALLQRWKDEGGSNPSALLRLARLRAVSDSSDAKALALASELAAGGGASAETLAEARALAEALSLPASPEGLEAAWGLAVDRRAEGREGRAKDAMRQYAAGCDAPFYAELLADESLSADARARFEVRLARSLFGGARHEDCRAVAERLEQSGWAPSDALGEVRFLKGLCLVRERDFEGSIPALWDFVELHPEHALAPDALYEIGRVLALSHERALALAQFDLVSDLCPGTGAAVRAAGRVAQWSDHPGFEELRWRADQLVIAGAPVEASSRAADSIRRWRLAEALIPQAPGQAPRARTADASPAVGGSASSEQ